MARESTMKPLRAVPSDSLGNDWPSLTVMTDRRMLATLGGDLRTVYEDLTEATQPSDLVRLAAQVDARRGQST